MIRLELADGRVLWVRPREIRQVEVERDEVNFPNRCRVLIGTGSEPRWHEVRESAQSLFDRLYPEPGLRPR